METVQPTLPVARRGRAALAAVALLAALGSGCTRDEAPRPPPQVAPAPAQPAAQPAPKLETTHVPQRSALVEAERAWALMAAIFPEGVRQEENDTMLAQAGSGDEAGYYLMSLMSVKELADGSVVVVTNGTMSNEEAEDLSGHGTGGQLNVYTLRREGEAWRVLSRQENIDQIGSNGSMGGIEWIDVAPGKPGFVASGGGVWQGYSLETAGIFALDGKVRALGNFMIASSSSGACEPNGDTCWNIAGTMRFVDAAGPKGYRDILVDFTGKRYTVSEDKGGKETEKLVGKVEQTARYRFDGKTYALVSGENPATETGEP